jgi:dTDP-4-dehydrorhamnose reductase
MRLCIVGGTGMLGHCLLRELSKTHETWATLRHINDSVLALPNVSPGRLFGDVDVLDYDSIVRAFARIRPDVVINCVGLIKQRKEARSPLASICVNAQLPHRLSLLCDVIGARLIHFSTDCVFSGSRGMYTEQDTPDASDLYGRTKLLGEITDQPHCLTLRTSLIGRELKTHFGLVEWFLAQHGSAKGYQRAIFSGFPTVIIATILRDYILPNSQLSGLYHLSADPISKYELLQLIKDACTKDIEIVPESHVVIDRSLNSDRFRAATRFEPLPWPDMVDEMFAQGPAH